MTALFKLVAVLLVGLTIIYWALVLYFRAGERARLEAEWRRERPPLPEHTFVGIGLRDYEAGLRRKLLWGVYVLPLAVICALVYYLNYA